MRNDNSKWTIFVKLKDQQKFSNQIHRFCKKTPTKKEQQKTQPAVKKRKRRKKYLT